MTIKSKRFHKPFGIMLSAIAVIIAIAVFQDFLHASRQGSSFYFSESILFKTFWLFFVPIMYLIYSAKRHVKANSPFSIASMVLLATLVHLIVVPLTIWCLSSVFREQSYGFYKVLTFTLSNDLLKMLLIYSVFVVFLSYQDNRTRAIENNSPAATAEPFLQYIVVNSGKNTTRIEVSDILYIKSATPYVAIQVLNKHYLYSESLKSLSSKLDERFVRIHRSIIVNISKVCSYTSRLNGDYDLVLQDNTVVRLSRNYVSDFRARFEPSHSSA